MKKIKKTPRAPVIKVEVTREIIAEGRVRDSGYCMLAEAVKIAFPDAAFVSADIQTIRLSHPDRRLRYTYLTPRVAQIALIEFDQGEEPEPFAIRLANGQVTRMSPFKKRAADRAADLRSDEQKAQDREKITQARKAWRVRLSAKNEGMVPDKIGGRPPPIAPLSRRRAFGLRALSR